jgi:hypothetical protein
MLNVLFPKRGGLRLVSWRYILILVIAPVGAAIFGFWAFTSEVVCLVNVEVVASSFGVLGGLLFAHAIFVFQLRVAYDSANIEPEEPETQQEDLRVRPLIDEMFAGVLYSSLVALGLTLLCAAVAATQPDGRVVNSVLATLILLVATHLAGCVYHVVRLTTTAYTTLQNQSR